MLTDVSSMKCFHGVANHAWRQSCIRQSLQFPNLGLPIPRRRRCGTGTCRHDTFTFNLAGAAMPLALRRVCNMQGATLVVVVVVVVVVSSQGSTRARPPWWSWSAHGRRGCACRLLLLLFLLAPPPQRATSRRERPGCHVPMVCIREPSQGSIHCSGGWSRRER